MFPPGTHPDGDPFAAQDEARLANSALGRMQARAQHEDAVRAAVQAGLPPPPSPAGSVASLRSSSRSTTSVYGTKKAVVETVVVNDTSDDEDDDSAQVQSQIVQQRAKPTSSASASSSKRARAASDAEMVVDEPKPVVPAPSPPRAAPPMSADATATASGSNAPEPTHQHRESSLSSVATSPAPNRNATPPPGPPEAAPVVVAPVKRQQHRSPSPVILPPRPPPRTVRLSIQIPRPAPGADVPEYSVADLAREAGFLDEDDYAQDGSGSASGGSGDDSGDSDDDADESSSKKKDKGKAIDQGDADKMEGVEGIGPAPATGDANGTDAEGPPKKRQRKAKEILGRLGGYDTEDPFVDDTELALYEPIYYHRPKREGYFVCSGPLEVISDAKGPTRGRQPGSKNKPKFDAEGNLIPATRKPKVVPGAPGADGAPAVPFASTSKAPAAPAAPKPRKSAAKDAAKAAPPIVPVVPVMLPSVSSVPTFGDGNNLPASAVKKKEPGSGFSPELSVEIEMLKAEIAKESFEVKNKFPPRLRPILVDVALRALDLGEYDDDFFAILPRLFPYNLFTMKKLVKREIFPRRLERIDSEQASHMRVIERGVAELLDGQRTEFDALHAKWEVEHSLAEELRKKAGLDKDTGASGAGASTSAAAAVPTSDAPTIAGEDTTMGSPGPEGEDKPGDEAREPKWKFKFNEPMRLALYHLYRLEDERSDLTTEKQTLEKATEREGPLKEKPYSALQAKKAMYARVAALWPEDRMTTNQLSREMSITKKKVEKDAAAA